MTCPAVTAGECFGDPTGRNVSQPERLETHGKRDTLSRRVDLSRLERSPNVFETFVHADAKFYKAQDVRLRGCLGVTLIGGAVHRDVGTMPTARLDDFVPLKLSVATRHRVGR